MTIPNQLNIWITGASSGIGLALTQLFQQQGHRVFMSSRNTTVLNELTQSLDNTIAIPFDVTNEREINPIRQQLLQHTQYLDLIFINAGDCEYLDLANPDWSMIKRVNDINLIGAVNTVAIALPLLQAKSKPSQFFKPHIVGISSLATIVPFPMAEAYGSSKAGLNYFLQSLRMDLRPQHIDVTTVLPGFVKTPLTKNNNFPMPFVMQPEQAAKQISKVIITRPRIFAFPKRFYWLLRFCACFPSLWESIMSPKSNNKRLTV